MSKHNLTFNKCVQVQRNKQYRSKPYVSLKSISKTGTNKKMTFQNYENLEA